MKGYKVIALSILAVLATVLIGPETVKAETDIFEYIDEVCEEYQINPNLVIALCEAESSLHYPEADNLWTAAKAVNGKGDSACIGLGQVSKKWHKDRMKKLGVTDLTDPYSNILVTVDYLVELFEELEDVALVLETYNGDSRIWKTYETGWMSEYAKQITERAYELDLEEEGISNDK